jgi:hypothetical protein
MILIEMIRRENMNSGSACKNLTDSFLLIMALVALICLVVAFISFEEYSKVDPDTGEEIIVDSVFETPSAKGHVKMLIAFLLAATVGFSARKCPPADIAAGLGLLIVSLNLYADDVIGEIGFVYVLFAVIGVAGGLINAYYYYTEEKKAPTDNSENSDENGSVDSL